MVGRSVDPHGLEAYFTNVDDLRQAFRARLSMPLLDKRLFVLHGPGGIGKSSLLLMLEKDALQAQVPVAFASIEQDEALSTSTSEAERQGEIGILLRWEADLKSCSIYLHTFARVYKEYQAIKRKVEQKAREARPTPSSTVAMAGKEIVAGAAELFLPIGARLVSAAISALGIPVDVWLRRQKFSEDEISLYLDPSKKLTAAFLQDMAQVASLHRPVLLLDTFELMTTLDSWIRNLAHDLHPNVLLVIAGQQIPDWNRNRLWPGWLAHADVQELTPMIPAVTRELITKYYKTLLPGEPDPALVNAIVSFAGGLPLIVTTAVNILTTFHATNFAEIKPLVVASVVDELLQRVPAEMKPALEAAAAVRWFDKEVLRAVGADKYVEDWYEKLKRFPFTRSRVEGLALHDTIQNVIDENTQAEDKGYYKDLHNRALDFFQKKLNDTKGDEQKRLFYEKLYHLLHADEQRGIQDFQEAAEAMVRHRFISDLRLMLRDVSSYKSCLRQSNSNLWLRYYELKLGQLEMGSTPNLVKMYLDIADSTETDIDRKLKLYALCDALEVGTRTSEQDHQDVIERLESSLRDSDLDQKLALSIIQLGEAYRAIGRSTEGLAHLERACTFYEQSNDYYGLAYSYNRLKYYYFDVGIWNKALEMRSSGLQTLDKVSERSFLEAELRGGLGIGWTWMGLYHRGVRDLSIALDEVQRGGDRDQRAPFLRDLGLILGLQGKLTEAEQRFAESISISQATEDRIGTAFAKIFRGMTLLKWGSPTAAKKWISEGIKAYIDTGDPWNLPLNLIVQGEMYEARGDYKKALEYYTECLELRKLNRMYFHTSALVGLARIKCAQLGHSAQAEGDAKKIVAEAEALAISREYNDHLSSLRLTQAHTIWDGKVSDWGAGFDNAFEYYTQALMYALRFNRFLLDEVLDGQPKRTPLISIVRSCTGHGADGVRMLNALRDWWQDKNSLVSIGTPTAASISKVPLGMSLLDAEKLARELEPGHQKQVDVLTQIRRAIGKA
jgi:tetratricopeptide (TPR) repeat protein